MTAPTLTHQKVIELIEELPSETLPEYVERVEREDAERAEALIALAHLRRAPLETLMRDFGVESAS